METAAQAFMNTFKVKVCYEVDGTLFKHKENAEARAKLVGKEVVVHELSAGTRE